MEKLDEEPHGVPWRAKENRRILQDNHHQLIPRLLSSQETVVVVVVVVFTLKTVLTSIQYPSLSYSSRQRNEFPWSHANPK